MLLGQLYPKRIKNVIILRLGGPSYFSKKPLKNPKLNFEIKIDKRGKTENMFLRGAIRK